MLMKILLVKTKDYEEIVIDFTDFQRNIEVDQNTSSWQISFNISRTDYNSFVFDLLQSDQASLILDGQEYVIQQINPALSGSTQTIAITATHIYFDIQKTIRLNSVIDSSISDSSKRPKHTLNEYLAFVFSGSSYTYEIKGTFAQQVLITDFGNADGLSLINTLIDNFSCYVTADNQHVIIMDDANFKAVTQKQFRYLYNTDDISLQLDKTNLRTNIWVYPYKDDNGNYAVAPYLYKSSNWTRYGDSFSEPLDLSSDTQATTKTYTDSMAAKSLQDVPETTFNLNYYGSDVPTIGEVWMAIIEPMQLDVDVTIIGINDYPFDDTQPAELTFSNAKKDMLSIQLQISKKANSASRNITYTNSLTNSALKALITVEIVGAIDD
jgi:hypothetical protein